MRIPLDILPASSVLPPNVTIQIRGPSQFMDYDVMLTPVEVRRAVNGSVLPNEVNSLHVPDTLNQVIFLQFVVHRR